MRPSAFFTVNGTVSLVFLAATAVDLYVLGRAVPRP